MAYTIGTSHGPFSGTGNFVIAKPAGIRTVVTGIPSWTGHDGGSPQRYFRLGRYTLGNVNGFARSQALEYAQQLAYPIPPIWELLSYEVRDGASCLFQELVEVPDLTAKQPWDRTPTFWAQLGQSLPAPGAGTTTMWTYTVPTGRRLMLGRSSVRAHHYAAPTAVGAVVVSLSAAGVSILSVDHRIGTAGVVVEDAQNAGALYLPPGAVLTATCINNDTGGGVICQAAASGLLFDA